MTAVPGPHVTAGPRPAAGEVPDTTEVTVALLRGLRRGRGRQQAASAAWWAYLIGITILAWGGSLVADAARALRHPPPPSAITPHVLAAAPAGLAALALGLLVMVARDGLWRGPATLPQATVDWLLDTPVSRGRLIRPRFRLAAVAAVAAGAALGIVPAAVLVALGGGGTGAASVLRLTGVLMLTTALLLAAGTGAATLVERYPAAARWLRRATVPALAAAAGLAGLAAWAALGRPPAALSAITLWSGPWGWAAQGAVALTHGPGAAWPPGRALPGTALLAVVSLAALVAGHQAAAGVPGPALRIRARTLTAMSAAALNLDTRSVATAYGATRSPGRARLRLRPPRRRQFVLLWRDLLAVARAPSRLAGGVILALAGVGLASAAARQHPVSLIPVACAVTLGYLAAAWLCEGARMDAEDTRRSAALPFTFASLAWRHAIVPALILLAVAGVPVTVAAIVSGQPAYLLLLAVTVAVLVAGALVNVFKGDWALDMFAGVDTPVGSTAAVRIIFWAVWGPLLAIAPMTVLLAAAISAGPASAALARAVILGAALAAALLAYAARRARRLRAG